MLDKILNKQTHIYSLLKYQKIYIREEIKVNTTELKHRIKNISVWKKGDLRAPHKPLLILYGLAQITSNKSRYMTYERN